MSAARVLRVVPAVGTTAPVTRLRRLSVPDYLTCRRTPGCVFTPEHKGTCLSRPRTGQAPR